MPGISAIVHTHNDALRIGRLLESLRACDEVIVFDHGSQDGTVAIARAHGARILDASGVATESAALRAKHPWILALRPDEAVAELLEAELYELRLEETVTYPSFAIAVVAETQTGWEKGVAETRLVPRAYSGWVNDLPAQDGGSRTLEGFLLRFSR
jgi:glycosyltransferase involved in cell wall biosynthesis